MMNRIIPAVFVLTLALLPAAPAHADWDHHGGWGHHDGWDHHGGDRFSFSFGYYGGYRPYYPAYYGPAYYPYYPAPYYYAPAPAVVYTQPAQVVYETPGTTVIQTSPPAAPSIMANQTSPDFTGPNGQQCREYQSGSRNGTACLQPDGTWRIVQ